jgi:hypothetical protein
MVKQAEIFLLAVMTVLICSSSAPAAIFEMQHALPGADTATTRFRLPGGMEGLYKTASIDRAGEVQFPSLKTGIARSEDLLWVAIGDAGLLGLRASPLDADTAWYLFDADRLFVQNAGLDNAGSAPKESTARETWAVILVGAGLIWFQLRRKTRHSAIRFTAS